MITGSQSRDNTLAINFFIFWNINRLFRIFYIFQMIRLYYVALSIWNLSVMSEQILYIVSDYVQWHESIDLASAHENEWNQFQIFFNTNFHVFTYRRKRPKKELKTSSSILACWSIFRIFLQNRWIRMSRHGNFVLAAMVKFCLLFNKLHWKCAQKNITIKH